MQKQGELAKEERKKEKSNRIHSKLIEITSHGMYNREQRGENLFILCNEISSNQWRHYEVRIVSQYRSNPTET